jgi:hypothetical protein
MFMTRIALVTDRGRASDLRTRLVSPLPSATHVGQWCPTGAGFMQSGQIGRPQRVQWTRVGRSGCR